MSSIKGPTQKPGVSGISNPDLDAAGPLDRGEGKSFKQVVGGGLENAGAARLESSDAVVEALRTGKITPDTAVSELTRLAVAKASPGAEIRARVESRIREFLENDPTVRELMQQMGATVAQNE